MKISQANRILVIGCPGSGKTTLSKKMAKILKNDREVKNFLIELRANFVP